MNKLGSIKIRIMSNPEEHIYCLEEMPDYKDKEFEFKTLHELNIILNKYQIKCSVEIRLDNIDDREVEEKLKQENSNVLEFIIFPEEEKKEYKKPHFPSPEELKNQLERKKQIFEENRKNAQLILKKGI